MKTATLKRSFEYIEGKTYYYVGGRNAYDNVLIGLFDSKESAIESCRESYWSTNLIKKATKPQIETFFGLK